MKLVTVFFYLATRIVRLVSPADWWRPPILFIDLWPWNSSGAAPARIIRLVPRRHEHDRARAQKEARSQELPTRDHCAGGRSNDHRNSLLEIILPVDGCNCFDQWHRMQKLEDWIHRLPPPPDGRRGNLRWPWLPNAGSAISGARKRLCSQRNRCPRQTKGIVKSKTLLWNAWTSLEFTGSCPTSGAFTLSLQLGRRPQCSVGGDSEGWFVQRGREWIAGALQFCSLLDRSRAGLALICSVSRLACTRSSAPPARCRCHRQHPVSALLSVCFLVGSWSTTPGVQKELLTLW
jgi:hypothetical protein